jgi:peptidoglycan/LPS O-acetylase OafA/YrhL
MALRALRLSPGAESLIGRVWPTPGRRFVGKDRPRISHRDAAAGVRHRDDIQGLRAVAVLLVVLGHAGVSFLKGGYVGVDVFFVLSGFLITALLLASAAKPRRRSLIAFYSRRARRILPAAALTLVVTDAVAYRLLNVVRAKAVLHDSIFASLFTANIHFAHQGTDYFAQAQPPSPVQHFWSLSVEEQFYVVWPVLLSAVLMSVALRRRRGDSLGPVRRDVMPPALNRSLVAIVVIVVVSFAWSIYYTRSRPTAAYFSTFARAWELGIGAALAIGAARLGRVPEGPRAAAGWLGLAAIAIAGVTFSSRTPFPGYAALLPTVGAALVIAAGLGQHHSRRAVGRVLSIAPLRYVGDRSYALYLWHWPVLIVAVQYEGHDLSVRTKLLLVLGAFGVSIVSYALFENPIRRMRWSTAGRALVLWPASVLAVILIAGWQLQSVAVTETRLAEMGQPQYPGATPAELALLGLGRQSQDVGSVVQLRPIASSPGDDRSLPAVVAAVRAGNRSAAIPSPLTPPVPNLLGDHYDYPSGCAAEDGQSSSNICSLGDPSGTKSLVVFGDSHAQMWMPAILAMASRDGWVVRPLGKSACIPLEWWRVMPATPDCRAWFRWAIREIHRLHPDVTLLAAAMSGLGGKDAAAASGISSFVTAVRTASRHVVVMGDTPFVNEQPVDCLLSRNANMGRCSFSFPAAQLSVADTIASTSQAVGASYISTTGWLCFDDDCPMVVGHTIVYFDPGHVTATFASALANVFRAAFRRAISQADRVMVHRGSTTSYVGAQQTRGR